ncbi:MAG: hypothetical protein M9950_04000 [Thermomicrobiales bacterium]|nr:hypothetical protein [Thermomicrobiales bacterium]MCO5218530.1 hypothetical protein [Thermomicrobiales bacterium]
MGIDQFEVKSVRIQIRGAYRNARLTMPAVQKETVPAIVFVHGSGNGDAFAFGREAERFAEHGVAFLSVDKVTDYYNGLRRNYNRLADDAAEAATWLGSQPGIDAAHIGLLGISEGCWVATSCAARHPVIIDFVILESAAVVTPADQMMYCVREETKHLSLPVRTLKVAGMKVVTYLCDYRHFDSAPLLASMWQPIFAVWGGADIVVPVDQALSTLKTHTSSLLTTRIVNGERHYLDPELNWLDEVAHWIHGRRV